MSVEELSFDEVINLTDENWEDLPPEFIPCSQELIDDIWNE